ncbi:MAG: hypothetical protein LBT64_01115 [Puniceicoccales bacterium]|jgi:hypothetical protein|nr:hypothetical protein [Puniceicoccales bacterium]
MIRRDKGVALIFVVLILLLLGSILASVGIANYMEILRIRREDNIAAAQDNAMFALGLAVGKIQKLSGRDTCATACAGAVADARGCKKYYAGVWDTAAENSNGAVKFSGWLVSDGAADSMRSVCEDVAADAVKIFSAGDSDDIFIAPIAVADGAKPAMRYGFWVSDESQKVKINMVDRYGKSSDFRAKKVHCCCPQVFDTAAVFAENGGIGHDFIATKIDFPEQLQCLDGKIFEKFLRHRHSLTLHSHGVLSRMKAAGLQRDLSQLARESSGEVGMNRALFQRQTNLPAHVPTLDFLASFFNLRSKFRNGRMQVLATEPMFRPQFPKDYSAATADSPGDDLRPPAVHGIYPLLAQANVSIGVAEIGGKFAITLLPQVVLWNPYGSDLQMSKYSVELCVPRTSAHGASLTLSAFGDAAQNFSKLGTYALANGDASGDMARILRLNFSTDLKAGEVKIFSLEDSQPIDPIGGNALHNSSDRSNFLRIDTAASSAGYSALGLACTNADGNANIGWNCFHWRLVDASSGKILHEIAELDPSGNSELRCERNMSGENLHCFAFNSRMKYGILYDADGRTGVRWLATGNPRAPHINRAVCQEYSSIFFPQNSAPGNWNWTSQVVVTPTMASLDDAMIKYLSDLILFDIPEPICGVLNVGYLRHVNFAPFGYFPSQLLGSSRANPLIPVNETFHENFTATGHWPSRCRTESLYDYAHFLNDSIFDEFFVSTVVDGIAIDENLKFLINRRFRLLNPARITDGENLAKILLIDGPFNVNSVSEVAWECVLSSVKNERGAAIFPRFFCEKKQDMFPSFDAKKIGALAKRLAASIVDRGRPCAHVGNFINRNVARDVKDCTRVGILQAAIDGTKLAADYERTHITSAKNLAAHDDISASGYLEENMPMVVNQGDIIQPMSHFLRTRGDTFLVRAFGDCVDGSGNAVERAYCEAIVQRVPEYVDGASNAPTDSGEILSETNKKFGRRYKIILFRWLDENEI